MIKLKTRCYQSRLRLSDTNIDIFYLVQEGWKKSLATCINCGELFVIDWENPKTSGLDIHKIGSGQSCPKCNSKLEKTLRNYPETFRTKDGELGSFIPSNEIPSDEESIIKEFWALTPS